MSRITDGVTIHAARNGFWVDIAPRPHEAFSGKDQDPWVFESFESMVKWLKENYVEGTQPEAPD